MRAVLLVSMLATSAAGAHEDHPKEPPKVIEKTVIVDHYDHDRTIVGALIGAWITYWIMRHRQRKHHYDPVIVTPLASCPPLPPKCPPPPADRPYSDTLLGLCEDRLRRAERACSK